MLQLKKYNTSDQKSWNDFVHQSNNGTIFQNKKFINYHITRKFTDHSLLFIIKNTIVAVFPAALVVANNQKILYSHPGSSFGGLVISSNLNYALINDIVLMLDAYCKQQKFNSILFVQTPHIYYEQLDCSLDYCLKWNDFQESEIYLSHATSLYKNSDPYSTLNKRKRRYIKLLEQSQTFTFQQSVNFKDFYPLLIESKNNFNIAPTHSLEELELISRLFPKECILILFYKNNVLVGGSLILIANKTTGLVFYNVVRDKYKTTQLASYQFYQCIKFCIEKKLKYIDFGVSHLPQDNNPLTPKLSLIQFKEQFGSKGLIRYVYEKTYNIKK